MPNIAPPVLQDYNTYDAYIRDYNLWKRSGDYTGTPVIMSGTGIIAATTSSTGVGRTITGTAPIAVANGDGITANPTVSLNDTAVSAGTYGSTSSVGIFTVDSKGRLTNASNSGIILNQSSVTSLVSDLAAKQPLDSDLTAIAALTTTVFGRGLLTETDATSTKTTLGVPTLAHGTYTPTLTNVSNLDASTAYQCQYLQIGNTVTVSGKVDVDPTAAASTQLGISLPVASNIGATEDVAGVAFASGISGQGAGVLGDSANDRATMQWVAVDVTNQAMYFTFTYQVI